MGEIDIKAGMKLQTKTLDQTESANTISGSDIVAIGRGSKLLHMDYDEFSSTFMNGIGNALRTDEPDGHTFTYNVIDGAGIYTHFLVSAGTPAEFTSDEINSGDWQLVLPQGATFWVKRRRAAGWGGSDFASNLQKEMNGDFVIPNVQGRTTGGTASDNIYSGIYIINSEGSRFDSDTFLTSIAVNIDTVEGGHFSIVVGTFDGTKYTVREEIRTVAISAPGIITIPCNTYKILAGESVALKGPDSGTGPKIFFNGGTGNLWPTNKFIQFSSSGSILGQGPDSSFYAIEYRFSSDPSVLKANLVSKDGFDDALADSAVDKVSPPIGIGVDMNFNNTLNAGDETYILMGDKAPSDGTITSVSFNCGNTVTATFVLGVLDQYNKFIEQSSFTHACTPGVNTFSPNVPVVAGQYLGFKTPPMTQIRYNAGVSSAFSWWVPDVAGYGQPLSHYTGYYLALTYQMTKTIKPPYATRQELDDLKSSIPDPTIIKPLYTFTPDGRKVRLVVNNALSVSAIEARYTRLLVLGNSITKHAITSYWWGLWGMAASTREKDFAHRLLTKLLPANPTLTLAAENPFDWESNHVAFDYSQLDPFFTNVPDLIVLRLGENVSSMTGYQASCEALINYCKSKAPFATIIMTGVLFTDAAKDAAQLAAAASAGVAYVSLSDLWTAENQSYIGAVVQGDDGFSHTVDNPGVAIHPNDLGMDRIADRILTTL